MVVHVAHFISGECGYGIANAEPRSDIETRKYEQVSRSRTRVPTGLPTEPPDIQCLRNPSH